MLTETPGLSDFMGHGTFHAKTLTISGKVRQVGHSRATRDSRNYQQQPPQLLT